MKLLRITENGSLHFELADGRIGVTYESGYVRVSTKHHTPKKARMYQINQQKLDDPSKSYSSIRRVLIPNHVDRVRRLIDFNLKNCQN